LATKKRYYPIARTHPK